MTKSISMRAVAATLALTTAVWMVGAALIIPVAQGATVEELLAQIATLQAEVLALQGGNNSGSCYTFTRDLTIGSTGADVTALQDYLTGTGDFTFGGGSTGYFGPITQAAVSSWQASNGVSPTAGYWGPLSQAQYNSTCTAGGNDVISGGNETDTGITTPGAEGSMTVSTAPSPATSGQELNEGETGLAVLGIKVKAKDSDLSVQRFKLEFTNTDSVQPYKLIKRVAIYRDGEMIAEKDVNADTVTKISTGDYSIQIAGFESLVTKDSEPVFEVRVDAADTIDSTHTGSSDTFTVKLMSDGVRAIDGAGINVYGGATSQTATVNLAGSTASTATIVVSKNANTPPQGNVGSDSSNNADKVAILDFDVKATKDNVKLTDLTVTSTITGGGTVSTAYLYDGSTLVDSATVTSTGTAVFADFESTVSKDTTKTYTVKIDTTGGTSTGTTVVATVDSATLTAENSLGDTVTTANISGTATGNTITVYSDAAVFTLTSASITKNPAVSGVSSSSIDGTFVFTLKAVGGSVTVTSTNAFTVKAYLAETATSTLTETYSITGATLASSVYTVSDGSTATVTVNAHFASTAAMTAGYYSMRLATSTWSGNTTTFDTDVWKTSQVYLP